jgi:hypothetical protein
MSASDRGRDAHPLVTHALRGGRWIADLRYLATILSTPGQARHALRWLRSRAPGYLLQAPSPWLTFDGIAALRARMHDGMRVFEWGSGGSTLFWLRWRVDLCSIEHDPDWYDVVRRRLPAGRSVDHRLVPPDPPSGERAALDPADPLAYASSAEAFRGRTFRRYATQIDAFPDEHFDVVLVDGRARPSCIRHAIPKVRAGGVLVVDNADREYYVERLREALGGFSHERHLGVGPCAPAMWRTDLYLRP